MVYKWAFVVREVNRVASQSPFEGRLSSELRDKGTSWGRYISCLGCGIGVSAHILRNTHLFSCITHFIYKTFNTKLT